MLTKFNPLRPRRWPSPPHSCASWGCRRELAPALEKASLSYTKAQPCCHPAWRPLAARGVSTWAEKQVTVACLQPSRASCKSVYPSRITWQTQAFKLLKSRFPLCAQTLHKSIYCCSADCKIGRFTVAKKEEERRKTQFLLPCWQGRGCIGLPTKPPLKSLPGRT